MKNILRFICLLIIGLSFSASQAQEGSTYHLYYLGGQSNMDGYGYFRDLPDSLNTEVEGVYIYHGNPAPDDVEAVDGKGTWSVLQPGHGVGFSSDGNTNNYSERFGLELTLARQFRHHFPGRKIAFIKYSRGGASLDSLAAGQFGSFEPDFSGKTGINQYDHMLAAIRLAQRVADIDGDGKTDRLIPSGIFWMQGESDAAYTTKIAAQYEYRLKRLMDLIRSAFLTDDLPVVIGKISDSWNDPSDGKVWDHGELVQYAQEQYCRKDKAAAIVRSTRYYSYSDPWHYDSEGYIDLGRKMAEAMRELEK